MFELIRYITEVPEDDSNSKRAYRYPYYSVMLLSYIGNSKPEYYIVDDKYIYYMIYKGIFFINCWIFFNRIKM